MSKGEGATRRMAFGYWWTVSGQYRSAIASYLRRAINPMVSLTSNFMILFAHHINQRGPIPFVFVAMYLLCWQKLDVPSFAN